MKKSFKCNTILFVPDIVLYSNYKIYNNKRNGICLCLRKDIEKSAKSKDVNEFFKNKKCEYTDNVSDEKNVNIEERIKIVEDKMNEYSNYELVVTDRLHTMIFCYITKTKCLFLDNSNGKVLRVYNDWIKDTCNYIKPLENDIEKEISDILNVNININEENIIKEKFEQLEECFGGKSE